MYERMAIVQNTMLHNIYFKIKKFIFSFARLKISILWKWTLSSMAYMPKIGISAQYWVQVLLGSLWYWWWLYSFREATLCWYPDFRLAVRWYFQTGGRSRAKERNRKAKLFSSNDLLTLEASHMGRLLHDALCAQRCSYSYYLVPERLEQNPAIFCLQQHFAETAAQHLRS